MTKIMGRALAKPEVPVPPEVARLTGMVVYVLSCVMLLVTVQRWKLSLSAESCRIRVSPGLIKLRNTSMSMVSASMWLMLSCVADVCTTLFQRISPDPGSPDVAPVSAK